MSDNRAEIMDLRERVAAWRERLRPFFARDDGMTAYNQRLKRDSWYAADCPPPECRTTCKHQEVTGDKHGGQP